MEIFSLLFAFGTHLDEINLRMFCYFFHLEQKSVLNVFPFPATNRSSALFRGMFFNRPMLRCGFCDAIVAEMFPALEL